MKASTRELNKIRNIEKQIKRLEEKKQVLRNASISSLDFTRVGSKGNNAPQSTVENTVIKITELENEINYLKCRELDIMAELFSRVSCVDDVRVRAIITARFFLCWKWEQIATVFQETADSVRQYFFRYMKK